MARLRRKPIGTILHSDRGTQYTSWLFGHRLREAGLMGSMGKVACAYDNALMESFWLDADPAPRPPLLDTRAELAGAMFIDRTFLPPSNAAEDSTTAARSSSTPSQDRRPGGMITTPKPAHHVTPTCHCDRRQGPTEPPGRGPTSASAA